LGERKWTSEGGEEGKRRRERGGKGKGGKWEKVGERKGQGREGSTS